MHYALISFLNARPLWWGLTHAPRADDSFEFASPARCADLIAAGLADLALVPAIEIARIPDLIALPSICIASRAEVRSVLLVSRVPMEEIRAVALDPSSRTSVALAHILLGERLGEAAYRRIKFDPVERENLLRLEGHDAAVVIGDPALQFSKRRGPEIYQYDLAAEWNALFNEPFVFALWAGRRSQVERRLDETVARLEGSRDFGLRHIEAIAREASEELSLPFSELVEYFREALHYDFGERERRALRRFFALAAKYQLIGEVTDQQWIAESK
ncbi:MAG TPA: menaquinone biosynthesis protein [Thermoanaerobaculia bacterium]|nr:menaquinone biosynthesis protein [Thermoanaerobaculia bacterium]